MIPILSDDEEYYEFTESCDQLFDLMMPGDWVTLDTNLGFFITGQLVMRVDDECALKLPSGWGERALNLRHRFDDWEEAGGVFIINHATVGQRPNPCAHEIEMFCIGREPYMNSILPVVFHVRRPVRKERPEALPITANLEAR